jgi:hypothetical protein
MCNRGDNTLTEIFPEKIGKKGKTPKSDLKIFQKFLGNLTITLPSVAAGIYMYEITGHIK